MFSAKTKTETTKHAPDCRECHRWCACRECAPNATGWYVGVCRVCISSLGNTSGT